MFLPSFLCPTVSPAEVAGPLDIFMDLTMWIFSSKDTFQSPPLQLTLALSALTFLFCFVFLKLFAPLHLLPHGLILIGSAFFVLTLIHAGRPG